MPTEQEDFYCGIGEFIMLQPEGNKNIVEIIWKYKKLGIWCNKLQEEDSRWQGEVLQHDHLQRCNDS